jgi:hypothetical protein
MVTSCPDFCGTGGTICGVPSFSACMPSDCGSKTILTLSGNSACSCPVGEVGNPKTDVVCGTNVHVRTHTHTHTRTITHIHTHVHTHTHTHTHTHIHTHTHTHTHE